MRPTLPSLTAEAVCMMRASDQLRRPANRILDDPYAELFVGAFGRTVLATMRAARAHPPRYGTGLTTFVLCRHRFIDDQLARAVSEREVEQVVILGAGYDTRAYRFAELLRGVDVYELDFPSTARRKQRILARAGPLPDVDVHRVAIDFLRETIEQRLSEVGFARGRRAFFIWEGVAMYLTREAVAQTLRAIRALTAPGSLLAMDGWSRSDRPGLRGALDRFGAGALELIGEPVTFSLHPDDVAGFFAREHYELVELADAATLEQRYVTDGRTVYPPSYVLLARTA